MWTQTVSLGDLIFLGVNMAWTGAVFGFDWRIGTAIACYALALSIARAIAPALLK